MRRRNDVEEILKPKRSSYRADGETSKRIFEHYAKIGMVPVFREVGGLRAFSFYPVKSCREDGKINYRGFELVTYRLVY